MSDLRRKLQNNNKPGFLLNKITTTDHKNFLS